MTFTDFGRCCRLLTALSVLLAWQTACHASAFDRARDDETKCAEQLQTVGRALSVYKREHGQLPAHLSNLIPKYLADKSLLHCPADPTPGGVDSTEGFPDPRLPVSYSYEWNGDVSNGLPCPLGKFPQSDLPNTAWGSWRHVNGYQTTFFGDQVPVLRCFHHRPSDSLRDIGAADNILNLTPSGKIYHSGIQWEKAPETYAVALQNFDHDLRALSPADFLKKWYVWRFREYCLDIDPSEKMCQKAMRSIAARLSETITDLPDEQRTAGELAAAFFLHTRQPDRVPSILDRAAHYPGAEWSPIVEDQMRALAYHDLKLVDKEVAVYLSLHARRPDTHAYMVALADAYAALGQKENAQQWREKADPGALLVGRPAPDFTLPLLDGTWFRLKDALQNQAPGAAGKKAILVSFWFCGCNPCRREFPHLQELYAQLKEKGLELIGVNHNDPMDAVRQFVNEGQYTFKIGMGQHEDQTQDVIFDRYHVAFYPTSFLIDSTGKIVWRGVGFGPDTLNELPLALAKLNIR
jgi:peroxiredoxin